jgi:N-acetylglucosaminyldiphosphoundecaprenol N-acetyl-beta-D-mannosaminyltransferase
MVDQFVLPRSVAPEGNAVFGIFFSPMTGVQIVQRMMFERIPAGEGARLLVTANVDHISNLVRNERFRAAYQHAWVATADGMPVYLYARLRDGCVPERVTGADLTVALLGRMPPWCRPFFVVGSPDTAERLREKLTSNGFRADAIGAACPAFGFENDPAASAALAKAIRDHRATHVLFGLGAPKSETWIHEHRHSMGDVYALAIGASLDFYVGLRRRAPVWMQRCGLEWAWRVASEPARLFRRYFVESWYAIWAVMLDLFAVRILDVPLETNEDRLSA